MPAAVAQSDVCPAGDHRDVIVLRKHGFPWIGSGIKSDPRRNSVDGGIGVCL